MAEDFPPYCYSWQPSSPNSALADKSCLFYKLSLVYFFLSPSQHILILLTFGLLYYKSYSSVLLMIQCVGKTWSTQCTSLAVFLCSTFFQDFWEAGQTIRNSSLLLNQELSDLLLIKCLLQACKRNESDVTACSTCKIWKSQVQRERTVGKRFLSLKKTKLIRHSTDRINRCQVEKMKIHLLETCRAWQIQFTFEVRRWEFDCQRNLKYMSGEWMLSYKGLDVIVWLLLKLRSSVRLSFLMLKEVSSICSWISSELYGPWPLALKK